MTSAELLEKIKNTFAADEILTSWCQQTFGRPQTVFIDIDENNPPDPESDYPVIAVTDIREVRGDSSREIMYELEFGVGVVQEEIEINGNAKTMKGFVQAESLRELAEDALYRAKIADSSSRSETGSVSCFPLFISGTTINFKQLRTNRRGLPG